MRDRFFASINSLSIFALPVCSHWSGSMKLPGADLSRDELGHLRPIPTKIFWTFWHKMTVDPLVQGQGESEPKAPGTHTTPRGGAEPGSAGVTCGIGSYDPGRFGFVNVRSLRQHQNVQTFLLSDTTARSTTVHWARHMSAPLFLWKTKAHFLAHVHV